MAMTFDEARKRHLGWLDILYGNLRHIAADSAWCNADFREFTEALGTFTDQLDICRALNVAEMQATEEP